METIFNNQLLFGEDVLNRIHLFAGPWLDAAMFAITSAGSELFYLVMLPILYWCWNKRKAVYAGTIFLFSATINSALKELFNHPRPDPTKLLPGIAELAIKYLPHSPGFPSGHAQSAASFWGPVALMTKDLKVQTWCILPIILISYSRLYLGVHYLGDVFGGLFLGAVCLAIMIPAASVIEKHYAAMNRLAIISMLIAVPIIIYNFVPGSYINIDMGALSGFLVGVFMAEERIKFNPANRLANQVLKIAIGLAGVIVIRFGLKAILPDGLAAGFFHYWLIGFWSSFGAPLVFSKTGSLGGERAIDYNNSRLKNNL